MATQITPVQRQATRRVKESKAAKTGGNILGAVGAVAGGIAGGIGGLASGGPLGAAAGATAGTAGGFGAGRNLGSFIGERIQPTRTITDPVPVSGGPLPGLQLSPQAQQFGEALQILKQIPAEIAAPHSRSLTAALMNELANINATRRI